jgi:hypothetical protein
MPRCPPARCRGGSRDATDPSRTQPLQSLYWPAEGRSAHSPGRRDPLRVGRVSIGDDWERQGPLWTVRGRLWAVAYRYGPGSAGNYREGGFGSSDWSGSPFRLVRRTSESSGAVLALQVPPIPSAGASNRCQPRTLLGDLTRRTRPCCVTKWTVPWLPQPIRYPGVSSG